MGREEGVSDVSPKKEFYESEGNDYNDGLPAYFLGPSGFIT